MAGGVLVVAGAAGHRAGLNQSGGVLVLLGPAGRLQFPPSAQQEFISELQKMGTPVGPLNVQGDIEFQSQFFEPTGSFHAHVNYPTRGAEISVAISHPVGRWQIDNASFAPERER